MDTLVRIAEALGRFSARFVPSSFAIAVLLTLLTLGLALGWTPAHPPEVLDAWGGEASGSSWASPCRWRW